MYELHVRFLTNIPGLHTCGGYQVHGHNSTDTALKCKMPVAINITNQLLYGMFRARNSERGKKKKTNPHTGYSGMRFINYAMTYDALYLMSHSQAA